MKSFSQFIIEKKDDSPNVDLNLRRGRIERSIGRELNPKEVKRLKELSPNTKANIEAQARRENLGGYDDGKPTSVRGGKGDSNASSYNQHIKDQRRADAQARSWKKTTKTDRAGHIGSPTHISSTKGVKYKPPITSKLPKAEQELISQGKARRAKTTKPQDITGIKSKITADDAKRRSLGKSEYSTSTQAKNRYGDITRTTQDSKGRWMPDGSESGTPIREPGKAARRRRSGGPTVDQVKAQINAKPVDGRTIKKPTAIKQSEVSKTIAKQNKAYNLKRNLVKDRVARRNVSSAFKKTIENAKRTFGLVTDKAKKDIKLTKDIVNVSRDINRKPPTASTPPKLPPTTTPTTPKLPSSTSTPKGTSAIVSTSKTSTPKTSTPKTTKIPTSKTTVIPGTTPKTPKPKSNWLKNLLNPKAADQVIDVKATSVKSQGVSSLVKPPVKSGTKTFQDFAKNAGYTPTRNIKVPTQKPSVIVKPSLSRTEEVGDKRERSTDRDLVAREEKRTKTQETAAASAPFDVPFGEDPARYLETVHQKADSLPLPLWRRWFAPQEEGVLLLGLLLLTPPPPPEGLRVG